MKRLLVCLAVFALAACGHKSGSNNGGDAGGGDDGGNTGDGGFIDAPPFGGMCTTGGPQCSNCVDDDGDGKIDGQDIECTGPFDDDESSFSTGIPGDNIDAKNQDCFFDGNSGAGDDRCNVQTCCLLGITNKADCPQALGGNQYDPAKCPPPVGNVPLPQACIDNCAKLTPPGCDCFGCCTVCDANGMCYDIELNPIVSPMCDETNIADPTKCVRCTKSTVCGGGDCGGTTCVLCPGDDPGSLPPECNGDTTCPAGIMECQPGSICPDQFFCSGGDGTAANPGCCIGVIQ